MKQKLLNLKRLRGLMLLAVMCIFGAGTAWGAEVTFDFSSLASANNWANGTAYTSVSISPITLNAEGGGNNGKYYTSDNSWRMYNGGTVTITAAEGYTITDVTSTPSQKFTISNGTASLSLSATVKFTEIIVTYQATSSTDPSISADNVNIDYNVTSGSISYTLDNEVEGGAVTASITSGDWLTLGTGTTSPISFTCTANSAAVARTATVTLIYSFGDGQTVTKNVTVTQAGNPNVVDNISDITKAGTYSVKGTIVAKSQRGFIVGDGTGYVYYYNQNYTQANYNIGDVVQLSGSVVAYGGVFEFNASTTVTAATESNYVAGDPTILTGSQMDTRVGSNDAQLSDYVQYQGTLSVSGNYYNITNIEGATKAKGSISFPISTDFTTLNGKTVKVKGYYVGVSSSQYYNTMIGSIEEVAGAAPIINANNVNIACNETSGSIAYSIANAVDGENLTVSTTAEWLTLGDVDESSIFFTCTANNSSEARTATITLRYTGAEDKIVTVTQARLVADYATLPFEFDGGRADIESTDGLTQSGLDTDYGSSPKLKFNSTDDEVILKINERPGKLTFDIKGNTFSGSTFTVQVSEDGTTYTDLKSYTELGETQNELINDLGENVRYIKWIYTEKASGNVALGNIALAQYVEPQAYTVSWTAGESITDLFVFAGDESEAIENGSSVDEGTIVMVSVDVADGYELEALTVKDAGENDISLTEIEAGVYYSFEMPASNVTITATAVEYVAPTGDDYELFTGDLVEGDYIIYYNGKAMKNTVASDRLQYAEVTPEDDVINTADAAIVWHIAKSGEYWTIYNADANAYAASTGAKNKAQMLTDGTDDKALWTVSGSEETFDFVNKANAEAEVNAYLRENTTYGFACYASGTGGALSLYKKVETVPVTIGTTGYATLYYSDKALEIPDGVSASIVKSAEGTIEFETLASVIPAGTGVVLEGAAGDYNFIVTEGAEAPTNNMLSGSDEVALTEGEGDCKFYQLSLAQGSSDASTIGFYWGAENGAAFRNGAHKAYLVVPAEQAKAMGYSFNGIVTAIRSIGAEAVNGEIYTIGGVRVKADKLPKGIYIVNGKKMVVK